MAILAVSQLKVAQPKILPRLLTCMTGRLEGHLPGRSFGAHKGSLKEQSGGGPGFQGPSGWLVTPRCHLSLSMAVDGITRSTAPRSTATPAWLWVGRGIWLS